MPLNGTATLTYTLTSHDNPRDFSFTATLPSGLVVANPNGAGTDCGVPPPPSGLVPTINTMPGSTMVQFTGGNTTTEYAGPGEGSRSYGCVVSVRVQGTATGEHTVAPTLFDEGSSTGVTASATLTVGAALAAAASIPTLSEWGLLLLIGAMGASAFNAVRRKRG